MKLSKMKFFFIAATLFLFSCKGPASNSTAPAVKTDTTYIFKDSSNIAIPGTYKIEVYRLVVKDTISEAAVLFSQKMDTGWFNISSFRTEQWRDDLSAELTDFNNDGLNDLVYVKGNGARGSNRIMQLFIFKPLENSLTYIKNSDEYPNLYYNKETNTINAYIFTGCTTTMFLALAGTELRPIASIEQCAGDYIFVSEYDSSGQGKEILRIKDKYEKPFTSFTNYRPLTADTSTL